MSWQERYVSRFYRRQTGWVDGTTQFHNLLRNYITRKRVLEIGPGPTSNTSRYLKERSSYLVGLDVDARAMENPSLDAAYLYDGKRFPFPEYSFDVVVSDYVNEHIDYPLNHCYEVSRVLKDGGYYLFRTPNKFHYVSFVGWLTPYWFHRVVSRWLRRLPGEASDVYRTRYLFNTERTCREILQDTGMEVIHMEFIEKEPSYGMNSKALFLLFMAYERLVNFTDLLSGLRANILCVAKKGVGP